MSSKDLNIYYSTIKNFKKFERDKTVEFLCSDKINQLMIKNAKKDIQLEVKEKLKRKKNEKNRRPIKTIKFEEHKSKIDFSSCIGNEEFNNYLDAIDVIKNKYSVRFEVNVDEEKKKNSFRELLKKFFELDSQNSELSEENVNQYYDYLNNSCLRIIQNCESYNSNRECQKCNKNYALDQVTPCGVSFKMMPISLSSSRMRSASAQFFSALALVRCSISASTCASKLSSFFWYTSPSTPVNSVKSSSA